MCLDYLTVSVCVFLIDLIVFGFLLLFFYVLFLYIFVVSLFQFYFHIVISLRSLSVYFTFYRDINLRYDFPGFVLWYMNLAFFSTF